MSALRRWVIELNHGWYGCDSGCCGTRATIYNNGEEVASDWAFAHYGGCETDSVSLREFYENNFENASEFSEAQIVVGESGTRCYF